METGSTLRTALELANKNGYFRKSGDPEADALYDSDPQAWVKLFEERYHTPR